MRHRIAALLDVAVQSIRHLLHPLAQLFLAQQAGGNQRFQHPAIGEQPEGEHKPDCYGPHHSQDQAQHHQTLEAPLGACLISDVQPGFKPGNQVSDPHNRMPKARHQPVRVSQPALKNEGKGCGDQACLEEGHGRSPRRGGDFEQQIQIYRSLKVIGQVIKRGFHRSQIADVATPAAPIFKVVCSKGVAGKQPR